MPPDERAMADRPSATEGAAAAAAQRRPLPVIQEEEPRPKTAADREKRRGRTNGESHLRFQFANVLRLTDAIVSRAVAAYDRLFALDSKEKAEIYREMAQQYAQDGKTDDAVEALRKAVHLSPDDWAPWFELGRMHLRRKAPEAAVIAFEKAREAGLKSHRLHRGLAEALGQLNKHEQAATELETALRLKPDDADTAYQLGCALDRLGRYDEAIDALEMAIDLRPSEVAYHQSLGFTLESAGRRDDAVKCFKHALRLEAKQIGGGKNGNGRKTG